MRLLPLFATLLLAGCSTPAQPKAPVQLYEKGLSYESGGIPAPVYSPDIVIATIKTVSDGPATNANPPRVLLHIHEVLRGEIRPGSLVPATWNGVDHGIDYSGPSADAEMKKWNELPITKPEVGAKFILAGSISESEDRVFSIHGRGKLPFTPQNRRDVIDEIIETDAWVAGEMAKPEHAKDRVP